MCATGYTRENRRPQRLMLDPAHSCIMMLRDGRAARIVLLVKPGLIVPVEPERGSVPSHMFWVFARCGQTVVRRRSPTRALVMGVSSTSAKKATAGDRAACCAAKKLRSRVPSRRAGHHFGE